MPRLGYLAPRGSRYPRGGGKIPRGIFTPGGQAAQGGKINCYTGSDQSLWNYVPLSGEKNDVSSFSHSPLIRYLSNLQVRRTGVKAQMSWNLGQIGLFTFELCALECGIYFPSLISGERSLPSWAACLK